MIGRQRAGEVDPLEAAELQRRGAVLLDVRESDEWAAGHAPGAAHLPLARIGEAADRYRGQDIVAVCRSGARSGQAARALVAAGMDVRNLVGGMSSWSAAGLPVVCDDGSAGTVA